MQNGVFERVVRCVLREFGLAADAGRNDRGEAGGKLDRCFMDDLAQFPQGKRLSGEFLFFRQGSDDSRRGREGNTMVLPIGEIGAVIGAGDREWLRGILGLGNGNIADCAAKTQPGDDVLRQFLPAILWRGTIR